MHTLPVLQTTAAVALSAPRTENEILRTRFVGAEGKRRVEEVQALQLEIYLEHVQGMLEIVRGSANVLDEGLR